MGVDYKFNSGKQTTTAIILDSKKDAIKFITKRLGISEAEHDLRQDIRFDSDFGLCFDSDFGLCSDFGHCSDFNCNANTNDTESKLDSILKDALGLNNAIMSDKYTGTTYCHPEDKFNKTIGKAIANEKAKNNYNRGFKKALIRWQVSMLNKIRNVSPDTFNDALKKANIVKEDTKVEKHNTLTSKSGAKSKSTKARTKVKTDE